MPSSIQHVRRVDAGGDRVGRVGDRSQVVARPADVTSVGDGDLGQPLQRGRVELVLVDVGPGRAGSRTLAAAWRAAAQPTSCSGTASAVAARADQPGVHVRLRGRAPGRRRSSAAFSASANARRSSVRPGINDPPGASRTSEATDRGPLAVRPPRPPRRPASCRPRGPDPSPARRAWPARPPARDHPSSGAVVESPKPRRSTRTTSWASVSRSQTGSHIRRSATPAWRSSSEGAPSGRSGRGPGRGQVLIARAANRRSGPPGNRISSAGWLTSSRWPTGSGSRGTSGSTST